MGRHRAIALQFLVNGSGDNPTMNPAQKKWPEAKGARPQLNPRAAATQQSRPGVAQPKNSVASPVAKRPAAPSAYRPQPVPRVLQSKQHASHQPVNRSNSVPTVPRVAIAAQARKDSKVSPASSLEPKVSRTKPAPTAQAIMRPQAKSVSPVKPTLPARAQAAMNSMAKKPSVKKSGVATGSRNSIQPLLHSFANVYEEGPKKATIVKNDERLRKSNPVAYRDATIAKLEPGEVLYLHGHGSSKKFARMTPAALAKYLVDNKLPAYATQIHLSGCKSDVAGKSFATALEEALKKTYAYKSVFVTGTEGNQYVNSSGVTYVAKDEEARAKFKASGGDYSHLSITSTPADRLTLIEDFAVPVWEADSASQTCRACGTGFGFFTRKHHCRSCGQLVCDACSQKRTAKVPPFRRYRATAATKDETGAVRVCDPCAKKLNVT